jgi:hypothetical protein
MAPPNQEFWQRHPGLVWSNPEASDSVRIRAALLRPLFARLLDIALEFGLARVKMEWALLLENPTSEVDRVRASVERILTNLEEGFSRAVTRN